MQLQSVNCNINGEEGREADTIDLPADGSLPTCFYSIEASIAKFSKTNIGRTTMSSEQKIIWSDF